MSRVISVRDIQEMVRNGRASAFPTTPSLTPSARDFLNELQTNGGANGGHWRPKTNGTKNDLPFVAGEHLSPPTKKLNSKSPKSELEAFFNSPYAQQLEGTDLRDGPSPVEARICGRQRRQHGHPRWRGHRHLHAHARQQRFAQARRTCVSWISKATSFSAPRNAPAKS